MNWTHVGHNAYMWPAQFTQTLNFTQGIHAHFKHSAFMAGVQCQECQRQTLFAVQITGVVQRSIFPPHHRRADFFGRCFAHTTRDANHTQGWVGAMGSMKATHILQRQRAVVNDVGEWQMSGSIGWYFRVCLPTTCRAIDNRRASISRHLSPTLFADHRLCASFQSRCNKIMTIVCCTRKRHKEIARADVAIVERRPYNR